MIFPYPLYTRSIYYEVHLVIMSISFWQLCHLIMIYFFFLTQRKDLINHVNRTQRIHNIEGMVIKFGHFLFYKFPLHFKFLINEFY